MSFLSGRAFWITRLWVGNLLGQIIMTYRLDLDLIDFFYLRNGTNICLMFHKSDFRESSQIIFH